MNAAQTLSVFFAAAVLLHFGLKLWLSHRQIKYVSAHAKTVPEQFSTRIHLEAHQKAAAYTIAKQRLGITESAFGAALLIALTLGGGLQWMSHYLAKWLDTGLVFQVAVVGAPIILMTILNLPFSAWRQFCLEARFGFNRMTPKIFVSDILKSFALSTVIGIPLLALVISLMDKAGPLWWLYAWLVWIGFNAAMLVLYPTIIAPLFNKFQPLSDAGLVQKIESLLDRTGFKSKGVYVMDGSRRSSHANAYFTGLGSSKRVVFFDTLLQRLTPEEVQAVLAHELGHFKLNHITKRLVLMLIGSFTFFAALGWLAQQLWFYQGLGVEPMLHASNHGHALILFMLALPVVMLPFAPVFSYLSRAHEFEADTFAARHTQAQDLVSALVKLYQDNASTLTPDPLYSMFYDSHPPACARIEHLHKQSAGALG